VEFLKRQHKLFDVAGKTVKSPDHNDIKRAATGVGHQCIQTGSHFLGAAEPVG